MKRHFGDHIVSPILLLVVPRCDEFAQIACQLSGISVYEFEGAPAKWMLPKRQLSLEAFGPRFAQWRPALDEERHSIVQNIEDQILDLLTKLKAEAGFSKYQRSRDVYYWDLDHCFLNKWLFPGEVVSMGVYEDLMNGDFGNVTVEYCSGNKDALMKFQEQITGTGLKAKLLESPDHSEWRCTFQRAKKGIP